MPQQEWNPYASPMADVDALSRDSTLPLKAVLFSFTGRINRFDYWVKGMLSIAAVLVLFVALVAIVVFLGILDFQGESELVGFLAYIPMGWIGLAINVKRWHDRGKSGLWILLPLVPVIGSLWSLIELGFLPGTDGPNRYGPPPR